MQPAPAPGSDAHDVLLGHDADVVLRTVLDAADVTLHRWHLRAAHHRGSGTLSALYEAAITDARGRDRELLYVAHVSDRPVPDGAAQLRVGRAVVHVWQFPDDPFLPALRPAVHRGQAAAHLAALGLHDGPTTIHTASYRPTRRAVVVLGDEARTPLLYRKLLGGRTAERRRERVEALATTHDQLGAGLPVPTVLHTDPEQGVVDLAALPGRTLRSALLEDHPLPSAASVVDLLTAITSTPGDRLTGDPTGYADVRRHLPLLAPVVSEHTDALERLAAAVATIGGPHGTVHGDLHDGQLLVADGALCGVLDVDGAGPGPVALDAGRLLAHVEATARLGAAAATPATTAWGAELHTLLAAAIPDRHLRLAMAAAWVGLATGPVRVRGDGWQDEVRARVELALAHHARAAG